MLNCFRFPSLYLSLLSIVSTQLATDFRHSVKLLNGLLTQSLPLNFTLHIILQILRCVHSI